MEMYVHGVKYNTANVKQFYAFVTTLLKIMIIIH